jgi:hypothetical protein
MNLTGERPVFVDRGEVAPPATRFNGFWATSAS